MNGAPGTVVNQGFILVCHSCAAMDIGKCSTSGAWKRRDQAGGCRREAIPLHGQWKRACGGTCHPRGRLGGRRYWPRC
jgi:hypothetical protein